MPAKLPCMSSLTKAAAPLHLEPHCTIADKTGQPSKAWPRALCSESPSRSPNCCKPTRWRQLNHKGILAERKALPQKARTVDRTKTHDDQEPRTSAPKAPVLQAKTVKLNEGGNPCREESMKPKSITGGPHENARRPRARTCRSATSQRQHAHAEASGLHSSCRNPTARAKGKH